MTKHAKPRVTITDEMKEDILRSNLTYQQLAAKHSISLDAVYNVVRKRQIKK